MGTRHLTVVVLNKKIKVAQYGQWDGYPDGQGKTIMNFISKKMDLRKFKKAVSECTFITAETWDTKMKAVGVEPGQEWMTSQQSDEFAKLNPQLSRDVGGSILEMIQNKGARELQNQTDFAADSLFCEYAYVVDLDNKVLEVYKGFNTSGKAKGRFARLKNSDPHSNGKYSPVSLFKKIDFKNCNAKGLKELMKDVEAFYARQEEAGA